MSKELPYFQFEPAQYLTRDVSFCSLSAQGLFINICSYYWQRDCKLTKEQLLKRLNHTTELDELIKEGVIDCVEGSISVKFLDDQRVAAISLSNKNSANGSKGGRPKNPVKTEKEPKRNPNETQTKGIKEDNIKEDEKTEEEFSFKKSLLDYGFKKQLVTDWLKVRVKKKATNSETAYKSFITVIEKAKPLDKDIILEKCVEKSWAGLEYDWLVNVGLIKSNTTPFKYVR